MTINALNRSLPDWFSRVKTHQTTLPRFQRHEAWSHSNVVQMFNTILQNLPLGSFLVLEIGDNKPFVARPIVGAPTSGERTTEFLLDGQQRLTGLWRGLLNDYDDKTYFVTLKEDEETGLPYYVEAVGRWTKGKETAQRPFWANEPKGQWERSMIPLDLFAPGDEADKRYKEWSRKAVSSAEDREPITDIRTDIKLQLATYNLPYLSLPVATNREVALDVFIKMNTTAAALTTYDIVVAQVEAQTGESLHDMVAECKHECPEISDYYDVENLVLYASSLLQGKAPTNNTYLSKEFGQALLENWKGLISGVRQTVGFLENEKIYDAKRLPTDIVVPVLVALWADAPTALDAQGWARAVMQKYVWRAFVTARYEKSTNSRAFADFTGLQNLIHDRHADGPPIFNNDLFPLPKTEDLVSAGWPKNKDRLARAILAAAIRTGAIDFADGATASRSNLEKREYHHLFPTAFLDRSGITEEKAYKSLNCALVTWQTNRTMSDKEPKKYLKERLDDTGLEEDQLRSRLDSHLIPYEEMIEGNFLAFLEKRADHVLMAMRDLCGDAESA